MCGCPLKYMTKNLQPKNEELPLRLTFSAQHLKNFLTFTLMVKKQSSYIVRVLINQNKH